MARFGRPSPLHTVCAPRPPQTRLHGCLPSKTGPTGDLPEGPAEGLWAIRPPRPAPGAPAWREGSREEPGLSCCGPSPVSRRAGRLGEERQLVCVAGDSHPRCSQAQPFALESKVMNLGGGGRGGEQLQSVVAGVGALPGLGTHRKGPTLPLSPTCLTHLCGWSWGRWQGRGETRGLFRAVSPVSTLHRPAWRQWVCRLEPSWGCPRGVRWRRMGCSHGEPFGETKQHICQPKSGPPGTVPEPCTPL